MTAPDDFLADPPDIDFGVGPSASAAPASEPADIDFSGGISGGISGLGAASAPPAGPAPELAPEPQAPEEPSLPGRMDLGRRQRRPAGEPPPQSEGPVANLENFWEPIFAESERQGQAPAARRPRSPAAQPAAPAPPASGGPPDINFALPPLGEIPGRAARQLGTVAGGIAETLANIPRALGELSARYESGGRGVGFVSSGRGDPGGPSYGVHQLSSAYSMGAFLRSDEGAPWRGAFAGQRPGTPAFNQTYRDIAGRDPDAFAAAQHAFYTRTHFEPLRAVAERSGFDITNRGVQEALFSIAVQHGGAQTIVRRAARALDADSTPQDQIRALYATRTRYVEGLRTLPPETRTAVLSRYTREVADALAMASASPVPEPRQDGGGGDPPDINFGLSLQPPMRLGGPVPEATAAEGPAAVPAEGTDVVETPPMRLGMGGLPQAPGEGEPLTTGIPAEDENPDDEDHDGVPDSLETGTETGNTPQQPIPTRAEPPDIDFSAPAAARPTPAGQPPASGATDRVAPVSPAIAAAGPLGAALSAIDTLTGGGRTTRQEAGQSELETAESWAPRWRAIADLMPAQLRNDPDLNRRLHEADAAIENARSPEEHQQAQRARAELWRTLPFGYELAAPIHAMFESRSRTEEQRLERARQMARGEVELPRLSYARNLYETGASTLAQSFTSTWLQSLGILQGHIQEEATGALERRGLMEGHWDAADTTLYRFGQQVENWIKQVFPGDEARQFQFSTQLAQGFASTVAFFGQGALAKMLGAGEGGMYAVMGLSGAAMQVPDEFERVTRAIAEGKATSADRLVVSVANAIGGLTEALPFVTNWTAPGMRGVRRMVAKGGEQATEEMLQEGVQQRIQNEARRTYDTSQDPDEGVLQGALIGLITGGLFGAGMSETEARQETRAAIQRGIALGFQPTAGREMPAGAMYVGGVRTPSQTPPTAAPAAPPAPPAGVSPEAQQPAPAEAQPPPPEQQPPVGAEAAPAPPGLDIPSAEPLQDLVAQAQDLADRENRRRALWLPAASLDSLSEQDALRLRQALGPLGVTPAHVSEDFDGQGGFLIAATPALRARAERQRDAGVPIQEIIGTMTGSGTGKPASPTQAAVVQQVTPEGAVARETLTDLANLPQRMAEFQAAGRTVRTVSPEQALARRQQAFGPQEALTEGQQAQVAGVRDRLSDLYRDIDLSNAGRGPGSPAAPVRPATAQDLDVAGLRVPEEPTEAQREAGNYRKGHLNVHGLSISIETPKGAIRRGPGWEVTAPAAYGYFKGVQARAKDKEHVDVYVGDNPASDRAYIVDQYERGTDRFDEPKVILGVNSREQAIALYDAGFSDQSGPLRRSGVTEVSIDELKTWLNEGDATKPYAELTDEQINNILDLSDEQIGDIVEEWRTARAAIAEGTRDRVKLAAAAGIMERHGADYGITDRITTEAQLRRHLHQEPVAASETGAGEVRPASASTEGGDGGRGRTGAAEPAGAESRPAAGEPARGPSPEPGRQPEAAAEPVRTPAAGSEAEAAPAAAPAVGERPANGPGNRPETGRGNQNRGPDRTRSNEPGAAVAKPEPRAKAPAPKQPTQEQRRPTQGEANYRASVLAHAPLSMGAQDYLDESLGKVDREPGTDLADLSLSELKRVEADLRALYERNESADIAEAVDAVAAERAREEAFQQQQGNLGLEEPARAEKPAAPAASEPTGEVPPHAARTRQEFIEALMSGVEDRGTEVQAPNGTTYRIDYKPKLNTYVVVSKDADSGGIAVTKGPAGPPGRHPWSRTEAAERAAEEAGFDRETGRPAAEEPAQEGALAKAEEGPTGDVALALNLAATIIRGGRITNKQLIDEAAKAYGGTLAEGKFDRKDAYDALESAVNMVIAGDKAYRADTFSWERPFQNVSGILERVPSQTVRSEEQVQFQQFSTPPPYALAVAFAAELQNGDVVLEPSAGTGSLVAAASRTGVTIIANELSDRRAGLLRELIGKENGGVGGEVFQEDAEQIDNILPDRVKPTVVIMNPPFSRAGARMGNKMVPMTAANHIAAALNRLQPGGRLVAITGPGMSMEAPTFRNWWKKIGEEYTVRANIAVNGDVYKKYGTTFGTRLIVIDKVAPTGEAPVTAEVNTVGDLMRTLEPIRNARPAIETAAAGAEGELGRPEPAGPGATQEGQGGRPAALSPSAQPGGVGPGERGPRGVAGPGTGGPAVAGGRPVRVEGGERPGVAEGQSERPGPGRAGEEPAQQPAAGEQPETGGRPGPERDLGPAVRGEREPAAGGERAELEHATPGTQAANNEITESLYEHYAPQRVRVKGAKPHPGPLVQSAAMASVDPPVATYQPHLAKKVIDDGLLSIAQLEAVVYAGQAHTKILPAPEAKEGEPAPVEQRRGFFIGDGTGVGKGREIAGIILDNWSQGRTKAVWVSEKRPLMKDAVRDWSGLGQNPSLIFDVGKTKAGEPMKAPRGIAFVTYDTLKGGLSDQAALAKGNLVRKQNVSVNGRPGVVQRVEKGRTGNVIVKFEDGSTVSVLPGEIKREETAEVRSRVDQIVDWFGPDFDGVIAFDESHNMGNAVQSKGSRGMKDAAQKALAGLLLQRRLPNARVVYVSATGATEVSNLAYAERLGLWGRGTPFASQANFVSEVASGGIAAMELVARDMKQLGLYMARNLSYDDGTPKGRVEYDRIEHTLDTNQREIYDTLAEAWQVVLRNINDALAATGGAEDGRAKAAAYSSFWGAHQRFFNQIITSLQMPSVIRAVEKDIAEGRQAVLQLTNTNEASQERAAAKATTAEEIEDLDITPRDQIVQLIETSFPTQQYEEYTDEDGNVRMRPVKDSEGNPVQNKKAVALKEALIERVSSVRVPQGPLDLVLDHFGIENVAEVTGRGRRFVMKPDPKTGQRRRMEESRPGSANVAEADAFQAGKKKILVFSEAGGTGRSYHADNTSPSKKARRAHYLVQGGWRADKAVQGFGRTHRTNQDTAPIFRLVTTDLKGQKRFISSIARRLAQLGALTKGQRQAGDQGVFSARDNLESTEARSALTQFFRDLGRDEVKGVRIDEFEKQTGLKLRDDNGNMKGELPEITQFLNRLLSLKITLQNRVFDAFSDRLDAVIEARSAAGLLDVGLETVRADKITKDTDRIVHTEAESGAETKYAKFTLANRFHPTRFNKVASDKRRPVVAWARSPNDKIYAVVEAPNKTDASGNVVPQYRLISPVSDPRLINRDNIEGKPAQGYGRPAVESKWTKIGKEQAEALWQEEIDQAPEFITRDLNLITGAILPIWDRLRGSTRVVRLQTDSGERNIGRVVEKKDLVTTLKNLGAEAEQAKVSPEQTFERLMAGGRVRLANGWTLARRLVASEQRIELTGPASYSEGQEVKADGIFTEMIQHKVRYFVPTDTDEGPKVLAAITKYRPVVEIDGEAVSAPPAPTAKASLPARQGPGPAIDAFAKQVDTLKKDLGVTTRPRTREDEEMAALGPPAAPPKERTGTALEVSKVNQMQRGQKIKLLAAIIERFKGDAEKVLSAAAAQSGIDIEGATRPQLEKFLSALTDLSQIVNAKLQDGYDANETLQEARDQAYDRLQALADRLWEIGNQADTLFVDLGDKLEDIEAAIEERFGPIEETEDETAGQSTALISGTKPHYPAEFSLADIFNQEAEDEDKTLTSLTETATRLGLVNLETATKAELIAARDGISRVIDNLHFLRERMSGDDYGLANVAWEKSDEVYATIEAIAYEQLAPVLDRLESAADDLADRQDEVDTALSEPSPAIKGAGTSAASIGAQMDAFREVEARVAARRAVNQGRTWNVPVETTRAILDAFAEHKVMDAVPSGTRFGTLAGVRPAAGKPGMVTLAFEAIGAEPFMFNVQESTLFGRATLRALTTPDGGFVGLVHFATPALTGQGLETLVGGAYHEIFHALERAKVLPAPDIARLVRHAQTLKVLDRPFRAVLKAVGLDPLTASGTLGDAYREFWRGRVSRQGLQQHLDDEAAAHLVELDYHSFWSAEQRAPVKDILDAIYAGTYARAAVASRQSAIGPGRGPAGSVEAAIAVGESQKASLDELGFRSEALEAARKATMQEGTGREWTDALTAAGVKPAEITATGLGKYLAQPAVALSEEKRAEFDQLRKDVHAAKGAEKERIIARMQALTQERKAELAAAKTRTESGQLGRVFTREDVVSFLTQKRVKLKATVYGEPGMSPQQIARTVRNAGYSTPEALAASMGVPVGRLGEEIVRNFGPPPEAKLRWGDYFIDQTNPTNREVVLDLPLGPKWTFEEYVRRYRQEFPTSTTVTEEELRRAYEKEGAVAHDTAYEQQPFRPGHYPNHANNLVYTASSLQKNTSGGSGFLVERVQSEVQQKARKGGLRDPAKIASLTKQVDKAREALIKASEEANREMDALGVEPAAMHGPDFTADEIADERFIRVEAQYRNAERSGNDAKIGELVGRAGAVDEMKRRLAPIAAEFERLTGELREAETSLNVPVDSPLGQFIASEEQTALTTLRHLVTQAIAADADSMHITPADVLMDRGEGAETRATNVWALRYAPRLQYGGGGTLYADERGGATQRRFSNVTPEKLARIIGEKLAAKLLAAPLNAQDQHEIEHLGGITVGGVGMRRYYNEVLPRLLLQVLQEKDPSISMRMEALSSSKDGRTFNSINTKPNTYEGERLLVGGRPLEIPVSDNDTLETQLLQSAEAALLLARGNVDQALENVRNTHRLFPNEAYNDPAANEAILREWERQGIEYSLAGASTILFPSFPLTELAKERVKEEGMPMFALGGSRWNPFQAIADRVWALYVGLRYPSEVAILPNELFEGEAARGVRRSFGFPREGLSTGQDLASRAVRGARESVREARRLEREVMKLAVKEAGLGLLTPPTAAALRDKARSLPSGDPRTFVLARLAKLIDRVQLGRQVAEEQLATLRALGQARVALTAGGEANENLPGTVPREMEIAAAESALIAAEYARHQIGLRLREELMTPSERQDQEFIDEATERGYDFLMGEPLAMLRANIKGYPERTNPGEVENFLRRIVVGGQAARNIGVGLVAVDVKEAAKRFLASPILSQARADLERLGPQVRDAQNGIWERVGQHAEYIAADERVDRARVELANLTMGKTPVPIQTAGGGQIEVNPALQAKIDAELNAMARESGRPRLSLIEGGLPSDMERGPYAGSGLSVVGPRAPRVDERESRLNSFYADVAGELEGLGAEPGAVNRFLGEILAYGRHETPPYRDLARQFLPEGLTDRAATLAEGLWNFEGELGPPMMSSVPSGPAPRISQAEQAGITREMQEALDIVARVAGKDVRVEFLPTINVEDIAHPDEIEDMSALAAPTLGGFYQRYRNGVVGAEPIIGLATNDSLFDLRTGAGHEAWHHVEEAMATEAEKRILNAPAELDRMRAEYVAPEINEKLREHGKPTIRPNSPLLKGLPAKETRAIAFARYRRLREEGMQPANLHIATRRLWDRIIRFLQAVKRVLTRKGYTSYEQIFEAARTGAIARRAARQAGRGPSRALAALLPVVQEVSDTAQAVADASPTYIYDDPTFLAQQIAGTVASRYAQPLMKAAGKAGRRVVQAVAGAEPVGRPEVHVETSPGFRDTWRAENDQGWVTASVDPTKRLVEIHASSLKGDTPAGRGYGTVLYQAIIDKALAAGYTVQSSRAVSQSARQLYEGLRRRGYTVETVNPAGMQGPRAPVYRITGGPSQTLMSSIPTGPSQRVVFTPEMREAARRFYVTEKRTLNETADLVGVSWPVLRRHLEAEGIALRPPGRIPTDLPPAEIIRTWHQQGQTLEEIAARYGVSRDAIQRRLYGIGYNPQDRYARPHDTLSRVADLARQRLSYGQIAKQLSLTRNQVAGMVRDLRAAGRLVPEALRGPEPAQGRNAEARYERAAARAKAYVIEKGLKDGMEHGVIVRPDGTSAVMKTGGASAKTLPISAEQAPELYEGEVRTVEVHHNHPNGGSLSWADIAVGTTLPAVKRIVAHGHNGNSYSAELLVGADNSEMAANAYWAVDNRMRLVLWAAYKEGQIDRDAGNAYVAHLVNQILDAGGVIRYSADFRDEVAASREVAKLRAVIGQPEWNALVTRVKGFVSDELSDRRAGSVRAGERVEGAPEPAGEARPVGARGAAGNGARKGRNPRGGSLREDETVIPPPLPQQARAATPSAFPVAPPRPAPAGPAPVPPTLPGTLTGTPAGTPPGAPPTPPGGGGGGGTGGAGAAGGGMGRFYGVRMRSWAKTLNEWWQPLERLPDVSAYRIGRYKALGEKAAADELARQMYDRFAAATPADKAASYAYLTNPNGDPRTINDPQIRTLAQQVKQLFNRIGDELVARGLLKQETVDHYRDQYLPRVYLKYLLGDAASGGFGGLIRGVNVARPSTQGYLKQRKDLDEETRALLGEVLDPGFLAARGMARTLRDLAIIDFLDEISQVDDWVFRNALVQFKGRNASPYYLVAEAESLDMRAAFEPDAANATLMRTEATAMRRAAAPALAAVSGQVPSSYAQIPDQRRYGMLRGMWVRKEIVHDLLPGFTILPEDASSLEKLFGQGGAVTKGMRVWKAFKVPLNPPTQIRNVISNAIMLNLSGMSPKAVGQYSAKAVREVRSNGPMYRFALSMGLKASGFSESELVNITREFLEYERRQWRNSRLAPVVMWAIALKHLAQKGLASAGDLYQWFEGTMKLAKMMYEVERNGMSRENAYLEAQRWLFDYGEVPRTVRYLRNAPVGSPFISYQYKALPLILEVAATKPWRLAPYVALPWVMAALFASMYGVGNDDVDKLRQALPEWMRKKQNAAILPWRDAAGRWQFFDFGYLLPWSSWQQAATELVTGHPVRAARELGIGGPIADVGAAIMTNVDPFTSRPIADPRDPPEVRAYNIASYAWRVAAPPWMTDQSAIARMWEAYRQTPAGYFGEQPLTMPQAVARGFGINVTPVDAERTRDTNLFFMRREIEDARRRMRSRLRDQRLDDASRTRLQGQFEADIQQRQEAFERYERESVVHPLLRIGQGAQ